MLKRTGIIAAIAAIAGVAPAAAADDDSAPNPADFQFEHVSCTGEQNEIRIVVDGVKGSHGLITADLYPNEEDGFLRGRGRLTQVKFAAKAPQTKFCVRAPEAGLFAVSIYHDENANGGFDKNGFGLPAEPWGISNNPKVRFAPPSVDKAVFEVHADTGARVKINLN